jgi:hypothetical protein
VLAIASTPAKAARLTKPQIAAALRRAGRHRGLTTLAATIHQQLRLPQLRHPTLVEDARRPSPRRAGDPRRRVRKRGPAGRSDHRSLQRTPRSPDHHLVGRTR